MKLWAIVDKDDKAVASDIQEDLISMAWENEMAMGRHRLLELHTYDPSTQVVIDRDVYENLLTCWNIARTCTGQMRRTAALITDYNQVRDLRYIADGADSTLDNIHKFLSAGEVVK